MQGQSQLHRSISIAMRLLPSLLVWRTTLAYMLAHQRRSRFMLISRRSAISWWPGVARISLLSVLGSAILIPATGVTMNWSGPGLGVFASASPFSLTKKSWGEGVRHSVAVQTTAGLLRKRVVAARRLLIYNVIYYDNQLQPVVHSGSGLRGAFRVSAFVLLTVRMTTGGGENAKAI